MKKHVWKHRLIFLQQNFGIISPYACIDAYMCGSTPWLGGFPCLFFSEKNMFFSIYLCISGYLFRNIEKKYINIKINGSTWRRIRLFIQRYVFLWLVYLVVLNRHTVHSRCLSEFFFSFKLSWSVILVLANRIYSLVSHAMNSILKVKAQSVSNLQPGYLIFSFLLTKFKISDFKTERLIYNDFLLDFHRSIQVDGKTIKAQIWDTAGICVCFYLSFMLKLILIWTI